MKKRIISCLLLCAFVILSLIACTPKAENFEGKTYVVKDVEIRINKSLNDEKTKETINSVKKTYGDSTAKLKDAIKYLENEKMNEVSAVSYKFESDGNGIYTRKDKDEEIVQSFKYEVKGKDKYLVFWFVDEDGNKIEEEQVFEISGSKLIAQGSRYGVVMKTTFVKSK